MNPTAGGLPALRTPSSRFRGESGPAYASSMAWNARPCSPTSFSYWLSGMCLVYVRYPPESSRFDFRTSRRSRMTEVRIGMVGYKFMGKAHSNAWGQVNRFFNTGATAVMRAVCGRNEPAVRSFAENWGWQSVETDWRQLVSRPDIDVVDIATPNDSHAVIAIEAAKQGKAIICEKP